MADEKYARLIEGSARVIGANYVKADVPGDFWVEVTEFPMPGDQPVPNKPGKFARTTAPDLVGGASRKTTIAQALGGSTAILPPVPINPPTITGDAKVGSTLTRVNGTWAGTGITYAHQWLADDVEITGETKSTYVVRAADLGKRIKSRTTATIAGALSVAAFSAATAIVVAADAVVPSPAPGYTNLLSSPKNLEASPPWYVAAGQFTTIQGARLVVAPGDGRQTVIFENASVQAGKTYVFETNFDKVAGSGAGLPRATVYKPGDSSSTFASATLTSSGNRYHTSSVYTATADGEVHLNLEWLSSQDNGCDITLSNFGFGEATAPTYNASSPAYVPSGPVGIPTGASHAPASTQLLPNFNDITVAGYYDYFGGAAKWALAPGVITVDKSNTQDSVRYFAINLDPNTAYTLEAILSRRPGSGTGRIQAHVRKVGDGVGVPATTPAVQDGKPYQTFVKFTTDSSGQSHVGLNYTGSDPAFAGGGVFDYYDLVLTKGSTLQYAVTDSPYVPAVPAGDLTQNWLKTPSYPTALPFTDAARTIQSASAPNIRFKGTAKPIANYTFGAGGNIPTGRRDLLDAHFWYYNPFGDVTNPLSPDQAEDTPWNPRPYYGVVRRYSQFLADGVTPNPCDLHVIKDDGLHLRAIGKNNNDKMWSNKNVYSARLRPQYQVKPGTVVRVREKVGKHPLNWPANWFNGGMQISPALKKADGTSFFPGHENDPYWNHYVSYNSTGGVFRGLLLEEPHHVSASGVDRKIYIEFDAPDRYIGYGFCGMGRSYVGGYVRHDDNSAAELVQPYTAYLPNSNGFIYHPNFGPPFSELPASLDMCDAFRDNIFYMRGDGSNIVDYIVDGKLVRSEYYEFYLSDYYDERTGQVTKQGMYHLLGMQPVPTFLPEVDGFPATSVGTVDITGGGRYTSDDMDWVIAAIDAWEAEIDMNTVDFSATNAMNNNFNVVAGSIPAATFGANLIKSSVASNLSDAAWTTGYRAGDGAFNLTAPDTVEFTGTGTAQFTINGGSDANAAVPIPTAGDYILEFNPKQVAGSGAFSAFAYIDGERKKPLTFNPSVPGDALQVSFALNVASTPGAFGIGIDHRESGSIKMKLIPFSDGSYFRWRKRNA
jgi:hypothetical protein